MKKLSYYGMAVAGLLLVVVGIYLLKAVGDPQGIMRSFPYLSIGIGCGIFGHGLGEILRRRAVKSDPALAKQIEIDAKDERNVMHANASKAKGYDMMTYVFGALMLAYALMGTSYEILLPFVAAYLFIEFFTLYHRLKLDKEQ